MILTIIVFAFGLFGAHMLADFVFQSETMAKGKNFRNKITPPPGQKQKPTWYFWMSAHAFLHGVAIYWMTWNIYFAILEIPLHFVIDCTKCKNWTSPLVDQLLHYSCKVFYIIIFTCCLLIGIIL